MKNPLILFLAFLFLVAGIQAGKAFCHVIPEDELRNQVYLSKKEALQQVFQGIRKIRKETRKISSDQADRIGQIIGQNFPDRKWIFYSGEKDGGKLFATLGKAYANSHPPTDAKFILLIDSRGAIRDIHIMEYKGPQRAEMISRGFLDQYVGKSADMDFSTVTSNQGPTPTTQALTQAVRRLAVIFQTLYREP